MKIKLAFLTGFLLAAFTTFCQQPPHNFRKLVSEPDTSEFKAIVPKKDGPVRTYIPTEVQIMDIDKDSTKYITGTVRALVCFEGQYINGKREGAFNVYVIDAADHAKRYRIGEQSYSNNKLNGPWKTYTLGGTLANFQTFRNDTLDGISRFFGIDGKTIREETEYFNGQSKFIQKNFYKNGKAQMEVPYENGKINGVGKKYYESGALKEVAEFRDAKFHGLRKYYYPNGQLWIEQIYKEGKSWTVVANYTESGQKRDAGTLKNGNGTVIFYNDDGSVRDVLTYVDGEEKK